MRSIAEMAAIVARHTGLPAGRVRNVTRKLQDAGILPRSAGGRNAPAAEAEHAVALIVGLLTDVPLHSVAPAVILTLDYYRSETATEPVLAAGDTLARMLVALANLDTSRVTELQKFSFHSSVSVVSGDAPAVVIRTGNADGEPTEMAFTADGRTWHPERKARFAKSLTLSGTALFRIANELGIGIEHRFVPATFEVA